jgi:hypothetical protein
VTNLEAFDLGHCRALTYIDSINFIENDPEYRITLKKQAD